MHQTTIFATRSREKWVIAVARLSQWLTRPSWPVWLSVTVSHRFSTPWNTNQFTDQLVGRCRHWIEKHNTLHHQIYLRIFKPRNASTKVKYFHDVIHRVVFSIFTLRQYQNNSNYCWLAWEILPFHFHGPLRLAASLPSKSTSLFEGSSATNYQLSASEIFISFSMILLIG